MTRATSQHPHRIRPAARGSPAPRPPTGHPARDWAVPSRRVTTGLRRAIAGGIRAERARLGLTQADLAARLAWSPATVAAVETSARAVAAEDLADVCRALEVTLAQLLQAADPADLRALGLG